MSFDFSTPTVLLTIVLVGVLGLGILYAIKLVLHRYADSQTESSPGRALVLQSIIRPLLITTILVAVQLAILYFFPENKQFIGKVSLSFILVTWTASLIIISRQMILRTTRNLSTKYSTVSDATPILTSLVTSIIVFFSCYFLFLTWGVNLTPLLAVVGIIGTALSFAARDVVGNTLSGVSLFATQPFKVGDYLIINESLQGKITEIGIQQTKLLTPDRTILIIPNAIMTSKPIENQTGGKGEYPFVLQFSTKQDVDLEVLKKMLHDEATKTTWLVTRPAPKLSIKQVLSEELHLEWRAKINDPTKQVQLTHKLLTAILPLLVRIEEKVEDEGELAKERTHEKKGSKK